MLWFLQDHPLLDRPPRSPGRRGRAATTWCCTGELRLPYMQIAPGTAGSPGMYVPNFVRDELHAHGDRSRCARAAARVGRAMPRRPPTAERPVPARPHALLGERGVPRRLVRLRQPARPGRRARHRAGHRDRRLADAARLPEAHGGLRAHLAGGVRPARVRRELVRREPRHGPPPRPRHDPGRGARLLGDAAARRAPARASRWCASRARSPTLLRAPAADRRGARAEARLRDPRAAWARTRPRS